MGSWQGLDNSKAAGGKRVEADMRKNMHKFEPLAVPTIDMSPQERTAFRCTP